MDAKSHNELVALCQAQVATIDTLTQEKRVAEQRVAELSQLLVVSEAARENLVQQAQQNAMEARTQRGTVLDILRHFGCPEEDWNALTLVKEAHEKEVQAAVARSAAPQQHAVFVSDCITEHGVADDLPQTSGAWMGAVPSPYAPGRQFSVPQQHAQAEQDDKLQAYLDASQELDAMTDNLYGNAQAAMSDEQIHEMWRGLCAAGKGFGKGVGIRHIVRAVEAFQSSQKPAAAPAEVEQWINVDNKLPSNGQTIFALIYPYNNKENERIATHAVYYDGTFLNHEGDDLHAPTHWMPMPSYPAIDAAIATGEPK